MNDYWNPNRKYKEIKGTKENLKDNMWLFKNVPWSNFGNTDLKVSLNEITTLYQISHVIDTDKITIETFEIDTVIVNAMHGFAGNSYMFEFNLGEEKITNCMGESEFAFSKDDLIANKIHSHNQQISGLQYQMNKHQSVIDQINKL
jgi:hypothetical protein